MLSIVGGKVSEEWGETFEEFAKEERSITWTSQRCFHGVCIETCCSVSSATFPF